MLQTVLKLAWTISLNVLHEHFNESNMNQNYFQNYFIYINFKYLSKLFFLYNLLIIYSL